VGGEIVALPASSVTVAAPPGAASTSTSLTAAAEQFPIVLEERFEKNTRGWPNSPKSTAWLDPDGLGYRLAGVEPGRMVAVGVPGQTTADLADVFVSATVRKTAGPAGGGVGLIVRDQQPATRDGVDQGGSYYVFEVSDRGEYGAWRRDRTRWVELVKWTPSPAVRPGGAENQLAVAAVGDTLTFLVNGTPVTTQTDTELKSGGVGLYVGGDGDQFLVDRLTVRSPKAAPAAPTADATRLVVRVPLGASDHKQVSRGEGARLLPLVPDVMASGTPARPAEVASDRGGLYYAVDNPAGLSAGQRVRVEVPLVGGGAQRKVVPYSSVIYDLKGDAWAYTSPAPLTFVRDRIGIDFIEGDKAVLSLGPGSGTEVVTVGAAELFGTEFGVGH
jgi:hypothetical protein